MIRIGVIGIGNMGRQHAKDIVRSTNLELAYVCDIDSERADAGAREFGTAAYYDYQKALEEGNADGVIVATPHYLHPDISIAAMSRGTHVLVEKPIAVHAAEARRMIAAYEDARRKHSGLVFSAMFMQRTYGFWKKIRELIAGGDLGRLIRTTWIVTDWFRTQYYYDTGGWRATWAGEGGGVLLNQCPHNLDLYQWLVGMPVRVRGFASLGKYHNIEVEDEVTAYFEHENGMVGHFITTTAESPGTNRLEIVGERGKLVFEDGTISFAMNRKSMLDTIRNEQVAFTKVENWKTQVPYQHHGEPGHRIVIENFAAAIEGKEELIAPAVEGINSVSLGNAIMYSHFLQQTVSLPLDEKGYAAKLAELIRSSTFSKKVTSAGAGSDMGASFQK
ncbi:MAG TPA: Gfo/Idh/MocA family oxidoreductase [Spirochaetia bacterium]|nr:Gfo/Idh/MocA family oxidoreductase [Spirochaetia bacterium]